MCEMLFIMFVQLIMHIDKEKGDIHDCGNYRGIKLMSHTMKIWERIID